MDTGSVTVPCVSLRLATGPAGLRFRCARIASADDGGWTGTTRTGLAPLRLPLDETPPLGTLAASLDDFEAATTVDVIPWGAIAHLPGERVVERCVPPRKRPWAAIVPVTLLLTALAPAPGPHTAMPQDGPARAMVSERWRTSGLDVTLEAGQGPDRIDHRDRFRPMGKRRGSSR